MDLLFILSGFFVGFIIGMTGVGGGSLMTPILVLGFGIKPVIAVGTDLLYASITKSAGVFAHQKHGNIQWKIVFLLSMGSVPASFLSIFLIKYMKINHINYEQLITLVLGGALIFTSFFLLFMDKLNQISLNNNSGVLKLIRYKYRKVITISMGVLLGVIVTLSSVGAGVIGAAFLFFLYPRYKSIKIVATDIAHAIPITAIAGLGHAHIGTVDYSLLINLLIGSLPGIVLGSYLGTKLPDKLVRPLLAVVLFIIGLKLII